MSKEESSEDIVDIINDALQGETKQERVKESGDAQSDSKENKKGSEEVPNFQIRIDKMRNQRDKERENNLELQKKIAQLEGKLSVLNQEEDNDVDPTEYMDDAQKFLYNENKELKNQLSEISKKLNNIDINENKKNLKDQENRFFENNPELKENREKVVNELLDYLEERPKIKSMLRDGELTVNEVYGIYKSNNPNSTKTSQVNDPKKVFSGHSDSVPLSKTDVDDRYVQSLNILRGNKSGDKEQAVADVQNVLIDDIISQIQ